MTKKSALATLEAPVAVGTVYLKLDKITRMTNIREDLGDLTSLTESIKVQGVLQPIIVRKLNGKYVLIAGNRRYAAAKKAGIEAIPAQIFEMTDDQARAAQVSENVQRKPMTFYEVSLAVRKIVDGKEKATDLSAKQELPPEDFSVRLTSAAKQLGLKKAYVLLAYRLLEMPKKVIEWVRKDYFLTEHVALLLPLAAKQRQALVDGDLAYKMARVTGSHYYKEKGGTIPISEVSGLIDRKFNRPLKTAPFPTGVPFANKVACISCPHNTSTQGSLFGGAASLGTCRKATCFNSKRDQVYRNLRDERRNMPVFAGFKFLGFKGKNHYSDDNTFKGARVYKAEKDLPKKIKTDMVADRKAKKKTDRKDTVGWIIQKPEKPSKKPQISIGWVVLADFKKRQSEDTRPMHGGSDDWDSLANKRERKIDQVVNAVRWDVINKTIDNLSDKKLFELLQSENDQFKTIHDVLAWDVSENGLDWNSKQQKIAGLDLKTTEEAARKKAIAEYDKPKAKKK